jgi:hypothetical protein
VNNICDRSTWFDNTNNIKFFTQGLPKHGPIFLAWLLPNNKILFLLPVMSGTDFIFLDPCPKWTWVCWWTFTMFVFSTLNLLLSSTIASSAENLQHLDFVCTSFLSCAVPWYYSWNF